MAEGSQLSLLNFERQAPRVRSTATAGLSHALEQARARLMLAGIFFLLAYGVVSLRLTDAMVLRQDGDTGIPKAVASTAAPTTRADIVDRNGQMLATTLVTASAYADPKLVLDPAEAVSKLVQVLPDLNRTELLSRLKEDKRFVWIKRNLTPREHAAVHRLGIPGLAFQREERRVYPSGSLTAHLVGFTGVDNTGLAGIERAFDQQLRTTGKPLQLAMDTRVQHILRRELQAAIDEFKAIGGAGIVVDARSGEVLSLVSLPDFDPHVPTGIAEDTLFNRATLGVYEMGSTFKIFNTAMALESGRIHMDDSFDATKPLRVGRHSISDSHPENRWLTVPEIFMHSSNIGSVRMALEAGTESQKAFMAKLGMTRKSPLELPDVGSPQIPNPWREINTMTISFGHGMSVSPIQLVSAVSAMVNGGTLIPPTIFKRTGSAAGERVISPQTSDQIRRLMRLVVTDGTAKGAEAPGYLIGGKTGTAEKAKGRGYNAKALLSSFVGAFPMHNPRYVVFAMIDEPKGNASTYGFATAGWTAAPLVGRIVSEIGPLLGMSPVDPNRPDIREAMHITLPEEGAKALASFTKTQE